MVSERDMDRLVFTNFATRHELFTNRKLERLEALEKRKKYGSILELLFNLNIQQKEVFFSSHKTLDKDPLNNVSLTKKGLHVARHIFANYNHNDLVSGTVRIINGECYEFDRSGYVLYNNFLPPDENKEIIKALEETPISVNKQPFNMIHDWPFLSNQNLHRVLSACLGYTSSKKQIMNSTFAQCILNDPDDNDEQKDIHIDTFFPALKFWYFPEEVSVDDGPFVYVKNSPMMTDGKLDWLYEQTNAVVNGTWEKERRRGHPEGSLRVTEAELFKMNLHACPVPVESNTLVVANVGGFHGRGHVSSSTVRRAIHGSIRTVRPFAA